MLAGISLLSAGIWFGYQDKVLPQMIALGAMLFCFLFLLFPNLTELRAGKDGFEAKIDRKIDELNTLMQQLRALFVPFAELGYILERRSTYIFLPPPRADHLRIQNELDAALLDIGVSRDVLKTIKKHLFEGRKADLRNMLLRKIDPHLKAKHREVCRAFDQNHKAMGSNAIETKNALEIMRGVGGEVDSFKEIAKTGHDQILAFFRDNQVLDKALCETILSDCTEELKDLKYYEDNLELRRPDVWINAMLDR